MTPVKKDEVDVLYYNECAGQLMHCRSVTVLESNPFEGNKPVPCTSQFVGNPVVGEVKFPQTEPCYSTSVMNATSATRSERSAKRIRFSREKEDGQVCGKLSPVFSDHCSSDNMATKNDSETIKIIKGSDTSLYQWLQKSEGFKNCEVASTKEIIAIMFSGTSCNSASSDKTAITEKGVLGESNETNLNFLDGMQVLSRHRFNHPLVTIYGLKQYCFVRFSLIGDGRTAVLLDKDMRLYLLRFGDLLDLDDNSEATRKRKRDNMY